jgi:hypothetical protein
MFDQLIQLTDWLFYNIRLAIIRKSVEARGGQLEKMMQNQSPSPTD